MTPHTVLSIRHFRVGMLAGYNVEERRVEGRPRDFDGFTMKVAVTPGGDYIGDTKFAYRLCKIRGIIPQKARPSHNVCSIGYCPRDNKWYGWSHRAIFGFGIGDVVKEGDCAASSGWTDEYLAEHPEENTALPVGFTAHTLEDAKRMAMAFAESVS